jgi:hypothetical protein
LSNVNPTNYFSLAVSSGAGKKKKRDPKNHPTKPQSRDYVDKQISEVT